VNKFAMIGALVALTYAGSAQAQGLLGGTQGGYDQGAAVAGPLGGIVGGAVGAGTGLAGDALGTGTGLVGGILGGGDMFTGPSANVQDPYTTNLELHDYLTSENVPSYPYAGVVAPGAHLPRYVTLYAVPPQIWTTPYRYTVANNQLVLVDPMTRRVVHVLN
jgi:hypothetical protein